MRIQLNALLLLLLVFINTNHAQDFSKLIQTAFENNKQLQSKFFELQSAQAAYREAKSNYQPSLSFNTSYTLAAGGRTIPFPIGDLLNPAYAALNQLTNSQSFPVLENQEVELLPNNFYDAKFSIQQALYYPEIKLNKQLKQQQQELKSLEILSFKRTLTRDIMQAYFQYRQLLSYQEILNNVSLSINEGLRVSHSLIKNGMAIPSAALRLESELASIDEKKIEAETNLKNAQQYLNFLLGNDNLFKEIPIIELKELPEIPLVNHNQREEILQLEKAVQLQQIGLRLEQAYRKPKIGLQLDLGSQDFDFKFQPYALLGANIGLDLYNGKRHKYKLDQASLNVMAQSNQLDYVKQQLNLQKDIALTKLTAANDKCNTYTKRINSSNRLSEETLLKFKSGNASYLELIDANNQASQAREQYNLSRFEAWQKWADYIYATANYPIQ